MIYLILFAIKYLIFSKLLYCIELICGIIALNVNTKKLLKACIDLNAISDSGRVFDVLDSVPKNPKLNSKVYDELQDFKSEFNCRMDRSSKIAA